MKNFKIIFSVLGFALSLFLISCASSKNAAQLTESEFTVEGVCEMCKERIENAVLDLKGVQFANWNQETHKLKVKYNSSKVSLDQIHQALANAGHDTDKIKASQEQYNKVHKCCRYREMHDH